MDEANFLEDTTSKQQKDLPYDGDLSQIKLYNDYTFTSKYDLLDVSNQMNLTVDDPQEKATHRETCKKADMATTVEKTTENAVNKKCDKQCTINPHIPANQGDPSKSNISDISLRHLCKEEFPKGQGINSETLPEISNADGFDKAVIKNIILQHVKNSWLTEQTAELPDQLNPQRDGENSHKPSYSPAIPEENTSGSEESVAAGESSHQENSNFLTNIKSPCDKQKSCQGQILQKQQDEKSSSDNRCKYGQGQVHCWFSDFSTVAPKVKISKNNIIDKPLTTDKQASFSPKLRDESAIVQDVSESLSRSKYAEKQEQKWKTTEPPQQTEMAPTRHIYQEHLTGIKPETSLSKSPSTSQKNPSSSSCIFQKIAQEKQMCQKLKEQTDQLKTKVKEFSKSIAQDSPYHLQDKRVVLEKLQGHLEALEQEFLANKEKRLTLQGQVHRPESPAVDDFDPERKLEGEIFKLEMLLEDFKEKINKGEYTSSVSLPVSPPINRDDLPASSSPPSNEEDLDRASGGQDHAGTLSASCAFCRRVLEWKQNMEKKGCRGINRGRFPTAMQDKALHPDSVLGSDTGYSCYPASGAGVPSNQCEKCGTKIHNSWRVRGKDPAKEFHYRYDTPRQNYFNHGERRSFAQLRFLHENRNSSPCVQD
ncbi:protein AKNAD1 [Phacochoerus africanus]|uniref:protein AKNAD1 n=1 Tax=Phacochoerus africanus TaxID=41426 RepID=UPI001FD93D89|nr:protein AKNAD1 [Phacochoerus africanus]